MEDRAGAGGHVMIWLYLAALAATHPAETPRQFVERTYRSYRSPRFSPLEQPARWFAPALPAAIREDERLAKGEVGYLDGDPLCDCQDYLKLTARIRSLQRPSRDRARALVHVSL